VSRSARTALGALLLAALPLAACSSAPRSTPGSVIPDPSEGVSVAPSTSTATAPDESGAPLAIERFAADVVSTDDEEYRISFAADGTTALFARGDGFFPQTRDATIYETRRDGETWTEPSVASFSGAFPDIDPWFSPDGTSVYFSSIRPVDGTPRDDAELFRVDRTETGWSEPVHLASLGSDGDELGASVSSDGTIVFASDRNGSSSGWDLFAAAPGADGSYGEPEEISQLNTANWEFNPAVSADGSLMVFTSIGRDGGSGLGDLFLAERNGGAWSEVGPLRTNSGADEYHASWSADERELLFVRRAGDGDLFTVSWEAAVP
jgi:Tol biopolymer transport system component